MERFDAIDWGAYYFFGFFAGQAQFLKPFMQAAAWLGSLWAVAIVLALCVALTPAPLRRRTAVVLVVSALLAGSLVEFVKQGTHRPRPTDAQDQLGSNLSDSFPSRAVFLAAFAWVSLAAAMERRGSRRRHIIAFYGLAILVIVFVCVSELWLALHFVTDIIAGLTGGVGLALIARLASGEKKSVAGG